MYRSRIILLILLSICCTINCVATEEILCNRNIIIETTDKDTDRNADDDITTVVEIKNTNRTVRISYRHPNTTIFIGSQKNNFSTKKYLITHDVLIPIRHLVCVYRE